MPKHERILILVAILIIGEGVALSTNPTDLSIAVPGLGALPLWWGFTVLLVVTACLGAEMVARSAGPETALPSVQRRRNALRWELDPHFWILPGLLTLSSLLFLRLFHDGAIWAVGLALTGVFLFGVLTAQHHSTDVFRPYSGLAVFALNLAAYLVAFTLFSAIYIDRARSLISATAVLVATFLLVLDFLHRMGAQSRQQALIYAGVAGLILGEITWGLNYWHITGVTGGAFLLLLFYIIVGVISSHLSGSLNRQVLGEFAVVSAAGLTLVLASAFWLR